MHRAVITECLPWIALLIGAVIVARLLIAFSGARLDIKKLVNVHRCQEGSVQSLSFVLTLPLFVMIMLFIVQVSQITIGTVVVNYSAYASVRSASVWIPARISIDEPENCISSFSQVESEYVDGREVRRFEIQQSGPKYAEIRQAAVLACLPLAPSRNLEYSLAGSDNETANALIKLYGAMDSDSQSNTRIPIRIANKLAYARANTDVRIEFTHDNGPRWSDREPDLGYETGRPYWHGPWLEEYRPNELGWRDPITVTVTHHMALMPGPGRLLARSTGRGDQIAETIERRGDVYAWPITATATLGNEGEKSLRPYNQTSRVIQ